MRDKAVCCDGFSGRILGSLPAMHSPQPHVESSSRLPLQSTVSQPSSTASVPRRLGPASSYSDGEGLFMFLFNELIKHGLQYLWE